MCVSSMHWQGVGQEYTRGAMLGSGAGNMTRPRSGHVVVTLADGRVLAIAGLGESLNGIGTSFVDSETTSEL